jgi:hypothetical protein
MQAEPTALTLRRKQRPSSQGTRSVRLELHPEGAPQERVSNLTLRSAEGASRRVAKGCAFAHPSRQRFALPQDEGLFLIER